jgi:large subunit ribosomal protein L6
MSRVGKKLIIIPEGASARFENGLLTVKGPLGEESRKFKDDILISIAEGTIKVEPNKAKKIRRAKEISALWGAYASHIRNMLEGVVKSFSKTLVIEGIGYRASKEGSTLILNLGFSHPVKVPIPSGIDLKIEKNTIIISGPNKEQVGMFTSKVRALKKPEPYKGKGIRYEKEIVRHKAGKKAVATTI